MPVNVDIAFRLPDKPVLDLQRHIEEHGDFGVRIGWSRSSAMLIFPSMNSAEQFARWILRRAKEAEEFEVMMAAKRAQG